MAAAVIEGDGLPPGGLPTDVMDVAVLRGYLAQLLGPGTYSDG